MTFKNVLSRRLDSGSAESLQKSMRMFESYVKREGLETQGPIIMKSSSHLVDNTLISENVMMIQLKGALTNVEDPYAFNETIRLEGYIMLRYTGPMDMIEMANMKLRVYAFENCIDLGPNIYSVYTANDKGRVVDLFQEVL